MTTDIASLTAATSFWEYWGYVALAAVLIGVIGESIEEFTDWPKRIGCEQSITRLSALILIAGLAGEVITQPNTNAASATLVAVLNKETGQLALDLEKERSITFARPWTKDQFDAIQEIKGKVTDVGILWYSDCSDCEPLAMSIEMALVSAGVQIYGSHATSEDGLAGSGVFVRLPRGSDLSNHPLALALRKTGLFPGEAIPHSNVNSEIRTDIPVIFVCNLFSPMIAAPYQPTKVTRWQVLPIEKQ